MKTKINTIEALISEKARLKALYMAKEKEIENHLNVIQDNFGVMVLESIIPLNKSEKATSNYIFDTLHQIIAAWMPEAGEKLAKVGKWVRLVELLLTSIISRFVK